MHHVRFSSAPTHCPANVLLALVVSLLAQIHLSHSQPAAVVTSLTSIPHSAYLSLRTCIANTAPENATACFASVAPTAPAPTLLTGAPPLILVPDCEESVLQHCNNHDCTPLFTATEHEIPTTATLLHPNVPHSAFTVEASRPSRRVPGGPYTTLVRSLLRAGYSDGNTLSAAPWDWRVRDGAQEAAMNIKLLLARADDDALLVARGAGCAIAAQALADGRRAVALLCIATSPSAVTQFAPYEAELGIRVRRRVRPLPVVPGPWGDGNTPTRCGEHAEVQPVPISRISHLPVRCNGDCGRWLPGAHSIECGNELPMVTEIECLLRSIE